MRQVPPAEDLLTCGAVEYYDKSYDKVSTKTMKALPKSDRSFENVTTTDDPNIRDVSQCLFSRQHIR